MDLIVEKKNEEDIPLEKIINKKDFLNDTSAFGNKYDLKNSFVMSNIKR